MFEGLTNLSWLQLVAVTLGLTHLTIMSVTLYLHRAKSHRALDLHPVLEHIFRAWLWLATGMCTSEWVSVHRKHHAHVETAEDPHSPVLSGIWTVLFKGVELYRKAAADPTVIERYGHGTPNDWIERKVYSKKNTGVILMLVLDLIFFGSKGAYVWGVQILWIPVLAAGVINGLGHCIGYRNYECADQSRNIVPWGILIGGEELHNNHHAYPRSAKLSVRAFEFDLGYQYIRFFQFLGLAKVKYVLPDINKISNLGIKAVLNARMSICREYNQRVLLSRIKQKEFIIQAKRFFNSGKIRRLLTTNPELLGEKDKKDIMLILSLDEGLEKIYLLQTQLYDVFYKRRGQDVIMAVEAWCQSARETGLDSATLFAQWVEGNFMGIIPMEVDVHK